MEELPSHAALASDDASFRAVADYTYDWESWHAPDGRLVWVNLAVARITGYSTAECLAMDQYPLPLIAPEFRDKVREIFASAARRTSGENVEFRLLHRDGGSRWMSLAWQPMYDAQARHLGFRTSIRDVTERQRLREQLRLHAEHLEQLVQERTARLRELELRQRKMEKLAALGQLAAGVAHEINNPLAGMRNAFELIKSDISPDHEHYELLELIDREIERISGITHQMYQLYRRSPQQPAEVDVRQIVGEVVRLLDNVAHKLQVSLRVEAPEEPLLVWLAEGEVKQVLYNLVRNALQASRPKDQVTVQLEADERRVTIRVQDNGSGIPPDVLPYIFDPFFSTKQGEAQWGMGLGLSVSRSVIEAMGGHIEVTSTPGKGSVFTAVFPRNLEQAPERGND